MLEKPQAGGKVLRKLPGPQDDARTPARKEEQQWLRPSVAYSLPLRSFVLISQFLIKPQPPKTKNKKDSGPGGGRRVEENRKNERKGRREEEEVCAQAFFPYVPRYKRRQKREGWTGRGTAGAR